MDGGLILSQALTLFTTPVIYLYLDEFSARMRGRRRKKHAGGAPADQPALVDQPVLVDQPTDAATPLGDHS
jgi:hypothetical protein